MTTSHGIFIYNYGKILFQDTQSRIFNKLHDFLRLQSKQVENMKLCELFSCCLPVGRKKRRNERMDPSKKRKRKEAKRLKKQMAGRRHKSVESLDKRVDGTAEGVGGGEAVMAIQIPPTEMALAASVSTVEDNIREPEASTADCGM